ncbi:MAG: rhamnogalacturonan acetylesterase [Bacteroidales bacterium]|nr:rhamnogalacturonan acetylesterase [Bacteroidales bacterium]
MPRLLSVLFVLMALPVFAADPPKLVRIVMVGDSTMASYAKPPKDRPDLTGWGQVFGESFTNRVTILNRAISGRSSKSFIQEGAWKKAIAEKPDFVFIQFGHNDQAGKPRFTDAATDFRDYLRQYIRESREAGAKPILVTPVARRTFDKAGKATTTLAPYADATIAVAQAEKVPVIDLHKASLALFDKLGDAGSATFSPSQSDRTHFSRAGAQAIAQLVADEVRKVVPELQGYLLPVER